MLGNCHLRYTAFSLALILAAPVSAQIAVDPEWPCVQPKVPELSMGQMWSGPIPPENTTPDGDIEELARTLAPRRVSVDDVATRVEAAMRDVPPETRSEWLAELYAAILERINSERGSVMSGIGRFAARQRALSERVDALQADLATLEAAPEGERDMDRIEELRDGLVWERRVFKDRSQSLTYVCEAPVLLEKRAFAIARELAGLL